MNLNTRRRITVEELAEVTAEIDCLERSGTFEGLFVNSLPEKISFPSKELLLQSVGPAMNLTKGFFKRIYGYELTSPGFAAQVISALERDGCSRARQYYDMVVNELRQQDNTDLKDTACWYAEECAKAWEQRRKGGEEQRSQRKEQLLRRKEQLLKKKRALLMQKLQRLTDSSQN